MSMGLKNICIGALWLSGKFGALCPVFRRFKSHSNRHVGTLASPTITVACSASVC